MTPSPTIQLIREAVEREKKKWTVCDDKFCPAKKACSVANHFVETTWNPAFDRLLSLLTELEREGSK